MAPTIAVFGASNSRPGDEHYQAGVRCGRMLAEAGYTVVTGGYSGTMEAVSLGARRAGGDVVGITVPAAFPERPGANDYVTIERPTSSLIERIRVLIEESDATIALWGSLGTATELLVAWNVAFLATSSEASPMPIVAVGEPWTTLVPELASALGTDADVVHLVEVVDDAVAIITEALG